MSLTLGVITVAAIGLSALGVVGFSPEGIAVTAVLAISTTWATSALGSLLRRAPLHAESSVITGLLIALIVPPTLEPRDLVGVSVAGALAGASKWLIAPAGRHLLNPAATGVFVASVFGLTAGFWWVATPWLTPLIVIGGALVAYRSGHGFAVGWFLGIGLALLLARLLLAGEPLSDTLWFVLTSYPLLFMGLFMVSEPLTMATRRSDQFLTATAMAIPTALPFTIPLGVTNLSSSPELALLLGNLVAWATTALRAVNRASPVTLHSSHPLTDTVVEYRFVASRTLRIEPGQWVELQLPHQRADSRGVRRVMSVSRLAPPSEREEWSFAVTTRHSSPGSSWKAALAELQPGARLRVSSVGGDFVPPHALVGQFVMVAGGVGVTPFAAQLFDAADRELGIEATLIVVPSHPDEELYPELAHIRGVRRVVTSSLDTIDTLLPSTEDISWAGVSGSPAFVTSARDALEKAGVRQVHTDRFIGY